jgi:hypothetical protein
MINHTHILFIFICFVGVNVSKNELNSRPVDVIRLNNKIREVDISGNDIETIDMSSVERYFPELCRFDASRNQLKHQ